MPVPSALQDLPPEVKRDILRIRRELVEKVRDTIPDAYRPGSVRMKVRRRDIKPTDTVITKGKRWATVERSWKGLEVEARAVIAKIIDSDFDARIVDRELRQFTTGHYARVRDALAMAIEEASTFASRQADLISWYQMSQRIRWAKQQGRPDLLSGTERRFLMHPFRGSVRAAMAWTRQRRAKILPRYLTAAQRYALAGTKHVKPMGSTGGFLNLSKALHGKAFAEAREVRSLVYRAISEAQSLDEAGMEMVRYMESVGKPISGRAAEWSRKYKRDFQHHLDELETAGKRLAEHGGEAAERDFARVVRKIKRAAKRSIEGADEGLIERLAKKGGRVKIDQMHSGLVELVQDARKWAKAGTPDGGLQKALDKFCYRRQRSHAERIIRTETHAAYRLAQVDRDLDRPWVYYIWTLAASHGAYLRKSKGKRGKRGGCICDTMAGTRLTPAQVRNEWSHGGHPNCACWFRVMTDRDKMLSTPITAGEDRWWSRYADDLDLPMAA